ncbi:MAG: prepilin-type cleavage/methylation domain-containing protein [Gallionella sp.]
MTRQKIPPKKIALKGKTAQQGVVLLEALIAILLFSMGVLALVGLQGAMIKNTSDANYRAEASFIAQQRIGQIWADPGNAITYLATSAVVSSLPSGRLTVTSPATNQYQVIVTWTQPGKPTHNFTTVATIAGG